MGQYWKVVNLDKKEFVHPHKLGSGLKLWEQMANHPGTGTALIALCAAMPEPRGGGDLSKETEVAKRIIGRWAGDRICLVGDYCEEDDLKGYDLTKISFSAEVDEDEDADKVRFTDISEDVAKVIEQELGGTYEGDGWRKFKER